MIIKGSSRGGSRSDAIRLAKHLLSAENEVALVLELRGVGATDLHGAIEEMRAISLATRSRRPLYHSSISAAPSEARTMTLRQWVEAANELEHRLGLDGHQRALVQHVKNGRAHMHVVWSRIDPVTLKVTHDGQNYRIHEQCARALERRWRHKPILGAHTRPKGTRRPVAAVTHRDHQAERRTGILVANLAATLKHCWRSSPNGKAFAAAVEAEGWCLASGRRGIVLIDDAGTPHSIPRRLAIKAAEVRRQLRDLDPATLPTVEDAKRLQPTRSPIMARKFSATSNARRRRPGQDADTDTAAPISPIYWHGLGYQTTLDGTVLYVVLPGGARLADHGHHLVLERDGEPTDQDIATLVAAGKARGWETIRFYGGSVEFQKRARIEALRQGYRLDQISLECEDGLPKPDLVMKMPDHIKRRLMPDPAPDRLPAPPPSEPTPAPRPRP